jgi:hypothetical protein
MLLLLTKTKRHRYHCSHKKLKQVLKNHYINTHKPQIPQKMLCFFFNF